MGRKKHQRTIRTHAATIWDTIISSDRNAILVLLVLVLATYVNALWNDFTFDDHLFVKGNRYITSLRYLPQIFTKTFPPQEPEMRLYRPLVELSWLIDYKFGARQTEISQLTGQPELSPVPFHITNVLIHLCVCILLYTVLLRFTSHRVIPFLSAAIFAVHPVHVEAIAWVVGRTESLCALFYLLSLRFFIAWRDSCSPATARERYLSAPLILSTLFFFAALLSKETAITLPVILLLIDTLLLKTYAQEPSGTKRLARLLVGYLPYFALLLLYMTIRLEVVGGMGMQTKMTYFLEKTSNKVAAVMLTVFIIYLKLLIAPTILNADYSFPIPLVDHYFIREPQSLLSFWPVMGAFVLVIYVILSCVLALRNGRIGFLLLWLLVTLLPVSHIIRFWDIMAERFLYLPSIGYCVLAGAACAYALERIGRAHPQRRTIVWVAITLAVACLGLRSAVGNNNWRNEIQLWQSVQRVAPENVAVYYALGHAYADRSEYHVTRANLARLRGDFTTAAKHHEQAAQDEQRAMQYYQLSTERCPDNHQAHYNLGLLLCNAQRPDCATALKLFEQCLRAYQETWRSAHLIYYAMGVCYAKMGDEARAAEFIERALRLKPRNIQYLNNLGLAYANLQQFARAEALWKKVLKIDPADTFARQNLEKLYSLSGEKKP